MWTILSKLTEKFEKENKALSNKVTSNQNNTVQITKIGWGKAKCYSEEELALYKNEWMNENKHLLEKLEIMKEQHNKLANDNEELRISWKSLEKANLQTQESNLKLSELIERNNAKVGELEEKNNKQKIYKKAFKLASKIECEYCKKSMEPKNFVEHIKKCPPQEEQFGLQQNLIPLKVEFKRWMTKIDEEKDYEYSEYELYIFYRNIKYRISKKINLFISLVENLEQHFPGMIIPQLPDITNILNKITSYYIPLSF